MSQDNEPITPKANHRVIDAEPTRRPNSHFKASDDAKQSDEPFKTKPSFRPNIFRIDAVFPKTGLGVFDFCCRTVGISFLGK
jgi:hypothetical protein